MVTLILEAVLQFILFTASIGTLWILFFGKSWQASKEFKENKLVAENMALIKLHSNSSSEISSFLEKNVQFLSKKTTSALLDRIDIIKYTGDEDVAAKCDSLKTRVAMPEETLESESEKQVKRV